MAPPAIGCIIGVSTSRYPRPSRNSRSADERLAAHLEHLARLGIDDQIEVALTIANLDVGEAMPLLRQRQVALREKLESRCPDRQLVGARAEQMSFDADDVSEVEQTEHLEVVLRERVLLDVHLDARAAIGEHEKIRLAEVANAQRCARS